MKTISKVDQIKKLQGKIYVRWSKSINLDNKRGYSVKYGTGRESGLSACSIDQSWDEWRIIRQLQEYIFCGGSCWIIAGDEVGKGEDNEPLLTNVEAIAKVSDALLTANWRKMELEAQIAADEESMTVITNEIGRQIIAKAIESNKRLLAKM